MSEATAVAEEVVTPEAQAAPEAPVVDTPPATPEVTPEAAAPVTETSELHDLPEWKETFGEAAPEAQPEPKADLPGEPVEEIMARNEALRYQRYATRMQATDAQWRQYMQEQLGLSAEETAAAWQKFAPVLRDAFQDNDAFNRAAFHRSVDRLPDESKELFYSHSYRNQGEAVAAIHAAGEARKNAEWEQKVAKGDYVSKAQAQKLAQAAFLQGRGQREQAGEVEGMSSGSRVNGTATNSSSGLTEESATNLPIQQVIEIRNRQKAAGG